MDEETDYLQPVVVAMLGGTLRDYFAGQALAGLANAGAHNIEQPDGKYFASAMAEQAYMLADALLAERAKK